MNKLIFTFIFIILILNAYSSTDTSECLETQLEDENSRRRLSTGYTEEYCNLLNTTNNTIFTCVLSADQKSCTEKSECQLSTYDSRRRLSTDFEEVCYYLYTSNFQFKCVPNNRKDGCIEVHKSKCELATIDSINRRLSSEITDEDCEYFETSDDSIYICVANEDGTGCEEMENSNYLKFSTTLILCLLLFI